MHVRMTIRNVTRGLRCTLAFRTLPNALPVQASLCRVDCALLSTTCARRKSGLKADGSRADQAEAGASQSLDKQSRTSDSVRDDTLSDPYPLPFSPDIVELNSVKTRVEAGLESKWSGVNLASSQQTLDHIDAPMRVPGRDSEARETKIARLIYQTRKRGTLETDLLLSTFAKKELKNLPDAELDEFDRLLDEPDWDIFYWCTQRKPIPARWAHSFNTAGKLGHRLVAHTRNDEKAVRWMPEL